uniref:Neutral ceramidase n=1 Tax=Wollemia nobilis TaxID=56998 RepID=A0A0C9RQA8_9CONI
MADRQTVVSSRSRILCSLVLWSLLLVHGTLASAENGSSSGTYLVGTGSYDITGPAADVNMMGYANMDQVTSGVHFRLRARTFIVAEPGGKRIAFVNLDACMASQIVTVKVLERLKSRYGDLYTKDNVAISGIHTHSGPGGYLQYVVYIVTSLGFVRQSFDVIVDGIEKSIIQAHENLRPGSVIVNKGELLDAGINRSPSAYLNNPPEERARYKYDVDRDMTLLKFVDDEWGPVGSFNWYATHGTSMGRTNSLISGDNKGAAARFMEDWYEEKRGDSPFVDAEKNGFAYHRRVFRQLYRRISNIISHADNDIYEIAASHPSTGGRPTTRMSSIVNRVRGSMRHSERPQFVAAFCQSNVGDVSPNVLGTFCIDTGLPCDFNHSTCGGKNELCYGRGPGYPDEFASTRVIGERQLMKAAELFSDATKQLSGKIDYGHVYIDFSKLEVKIQEENGGKEKVVKTCPAAMGFSFAAGTTDGPGAFDFKQGDDKGNPFWKLVRNLLKTPTEEQVECQKPKPILLDTGEMTQPYEWAPAILPIQILRIGKFVILCVPGEFTTMSGRRLREAMKKVLITYGKGEFGDDTYIVIAGLTNTYSQYVTTFEEYQMQRYEGGSTLYGPHTLSAYIQEFTKLAIAMIEGKKADSGLSPPNLLDKQLGFLPPVVVDLTPRGFKFGDVKEDVSSKGPHTKGDTVEVTFWSACPRNDLLTEGTFALVELSDPTGKWIPLYDDDDFCLRFKWSRPSSKSPYSYATIQWEIPTHVKPGIYRIRHYGAAKHLFGSIDHFTGTSSAFVVS